MTESVNVPVEDDDHDDVVEADVTHFHEDEEDAESLIGEEVEYDLGSDDDDDDGSQ